MYITTACFIVKRHLVHCASTSISWHQMFIQGICIRFGRTIYTTLYL